MDGTRLYRAIIRSDSLETLTQPLMFAVKKNDVESVRLLAKAGASRVMANNGDKTADRAVYSACYTSRRMGRDEYEWSLFDDPSIMKNEPICVFNEVHESVTPRSLEWPAISSVRNGMVWYGMGGHTIPYHVIT
jgi:hypothetical protein